MFTIRGATHKGVNGVVVVEFPSNRIVGEMTDYHTAKDAAARYAEVAPQDWMFLPENETKDYAIRW